MLACGDPVTHSPARRALKSPSSLLRLIPPHPVACTAAPGDRLAWGPMGLDPNGPGSQQAWGQGARQLISQLPLWGRPRPPACSLPHLLASLSVIRGQFLCLSLHFCSWYGWSKLLNLLSNCFFICKMGIIAILPMGGCGYSVS